MKINEIITEGANGPGLWDNINAKRKRIKAGSGERMRKPGTKGAPTAKNFKDAASEGVAEGSSTTWEVSYDYGPHMTKSVTVKAGSEEEARAKVEKAAEKKGMSIMINSVEPVEQGVAEGFFDRFKEQPAKPNVANPGNYPKNRNQIDQWMADTVEYYKATHPDHVWKLFSPNQFDYLPVRVRVGFSTEEARKHIDAYIKLRDANPEAVKIARKNFDDYHTYPDGPRDDYQRQEHQGVAEGVSLKQKHEDKKRSDQNQVRYGKMTQAEFDKKWARTERPKPANKDQTVSESYDSEELANEVYTEFERMYPKLARRADERAVHDAIMDVLNYGGDNDPAALAQDVARAVKRNIQGMSEGSLNEGQYEMMMRNGQVKKFIAKDDSDAKRIAAGHGAKSVIKLRGGVPAGKISEQGMSEGKHDSDTFVGKKGTYKGYGITQEGPRQWGISSSVKKFPTMDAAKRHIDKNL